MVRAIVEDDLTQSEIVQAELSGAETIALGLPSLCELVWVLSRGYRIATPQIAATIRRLTDGMNVMVNRRAVEAGHADGR